MATVGENKIIADVMKRLVVMFSTETIPDDMSGFDLSGLSAATLETILCGTDPVKTYNMSRLKEYLKPLPVPK